MNHPLAWVPAPARRPFFWVCFVCALVLLFVFQPANRPLMTAAAPAGIISLQLAFSPQNAADMLASWDESARLYAAFSVGVDYLFMPAYALALALGVLFASGRGGGSFARFGAWFAYAALLAAVLDALENLGQYQQLFHGRIELALPIGICAVLKFSLLLGALAYCLVGALLPKRR